MFLMFPCSAGGSGNQEVHLVDERGNLRHAVPSVACALRWLYGRGHRQVGTPQGKNIDVFLIEPGVEAEGDPPLFKLRRDPAGKATGEALLKSLGGDRFREIRRSMTATGGQRARHAT